MYNTGQLLLSLPCYLLHPPNHSNHIVSLYTALLAIRKCLRFQEQSLQIHHGMPIYAEALTPEMECQACTIYAEIGLQIIGADLGGSTAPMWCRGIEGEIESAIQRGLHLCHSSRTSLREYYFHLTLLHSHLTHRQGNVKLSRSIISRLKTHLTESDLPHIHYQILLCEHANYITPPPSGSPSDSVPSSPPAPSFSDIRSALDVTQELAQRGRFFGHPDIVKLSVVMRLRTLVRGDMWRSRPGHAPDMSVEGCIAAAEAELGLNFEEESPGTVRNSAQSSGSASVGPTTAPFSLVEATFQVQLLYLSILFYTQIGRSSDTSTRLKRFHPLVDALNDDAFSGSDGTATLKIHLERDYPLIIRITHPRVFYEVAFSVSSISRRDSIGANPKRKRYAEEGLIASADMINDATFPPWASLTDAQLVEDRLAKVKADLLCEMTAVCISRNEFEEAQHHISFLIAHARTYSIFPYYAPRITLHQAHLAHATLHVDRALRCYRAAAILDGDVGNGNRPSSGGRAPGFVGVAARAGEVALRFGLQAQRKRDNPRMQLRNDPELEEMARTVIVECRTFPGTLRAIGELLEAVTSPEIVRAKQRLKVSLDIATTAQDNHLRALIVALTSAHYHNTASEHAFMMLKTANRLAAGMGASSGTNPTTQTIGNAPLGLWSGERLFELYRKQGHAPSKEVETLIQRTRLCQQAMQILPSRLNINTSARIQMDDALPLG
ncbi:uncharacterized protein EI90DRAFT_3154810 [Cantharellus anzutake]|uniref:uncharacterized protein n=1 Tax=Cantharellus anzutake TaxID=1750568 RepID=UPI001907366C|nr:uncharacterized protein EI90DRAFT_3154810 [Cantharellus anzutake]KAF8330761.1 hypothetical protein EI90DRAFT_3154810 [Cantharellus anzutake]